MKIVNGLKRSAVLLGAIFTVFVDVCLERKERILGGEAGVQCQPSGSNWGEGVGTVKLVYVGELLGIGGDRYG